MHAYVCIDYHVAPGIVCLNENMRQYESVFVEQLNRRFECCFLCCEFIVVQHNEFNEN